MENRSTFIGLIRPTRPGFVEQMLPEEEAMQAHAAYLRQLLSEKTLFLAGPCLDRVFGLFDGPGSACPGRSPRPAQELGLDNDGLAFRKPLRSTRGVVDLNHVLGVKGVISFK